MPKKPWYDDYVKQVHGEDVSVDVPRDEDGRINPYVPSDPEPPAEGEDTYAKPLEKMTKAELQEEAERRQVVVDPKATKDDLVQSFNPVQTDFPGEAT